MKVINNHPQSLPLESGEILAASGTPGSSRDVESLSDFDRRRYVATGLVAIIEEPTQQPAAGGSPEGTETEKRRVK
ncbi:MAG: hypothetical protein WCD76_07035 [Pyrinomonadaceae bacterium]